MRFGVVRFEFGIEERVEVTARDTAQCHHPEIVDDEVHRAVDLLDGGVLAEDGALGGGIDVLLDSQQAFPSDLVEDLVHQRQQFEVEHLFEGRSREKLPEPLQHADGDGDRVRHDEGAKGSAADDDELEGLPQRKKLTAREGEPECAGPEHHHQANDGIHPLPCSTAASRPHPSVADNAPQHSPPHSPPGGRCPASWLESAPVHSPASSLGRCSHETPTCTSAP